MRARWLHLVVSFRPNLCVFLWHGEAVQGELPQQGITHFHRASQRIFSEGEPIETLERWDFEAYKAHGRGQAQEVESALREGFVRVRGCAAVRLPFVAIT